MRINDSETIALLENNASWSTIRQCFPNEASAARFASVYFSERNAPALVAKSGETIIYRVTWKRALRKKRGGFRERVINLMMGRMEFEEITFHTHHAQDRAVGTCTERTLRVLSALRVFQILITLLSGFGLLGVIGASLVLIPDSSFSHEDIRLILLPAFVCLAVLIVGLSIGLLVSKITRGLPFGHMAHCGFVPANIERLQGVQTPPDQSTDQRGA